MRLRRSVPAARITLPLNAYLYFLVCYYIPKVEIAKGEVLSAALKYFDRIGGRGIILLQWSN
jgi:hypothetical protein